MKNYWEERMKKYGHTGWSSSIIYAFDNPIRIRIVNCLLDRYVQPEQRRCLMDFGCGMGEFAKANEKRFARIILYDICVSVLRMAKKSLKKADVFDSLERLKNDLTIRCDAILSITVLQHIMDIREMESVLSVLRDKLDEGGGTGSLGVLWEN